MQEQGKFRYVFNGKEVSKEEFQEACKDLFINVDNDTFSAVHFSSMSNFLDGDFKTEKQINDHFKSIVFDNPLSKKEDLIGLLRKKCSDQCFCDGSCKKEVKGLSTRHKSRDGETHYDSKKFCYDPTQQPIFKDNPNMMEAYKETDGKLFYELDWGFITQMAERMQSNKRESKYELWNWKKPMTPKGIEDLKQASMRHLIAIMDNEYEDDGRPFGHLEALADNMMMINYQLKNKNG